MGELLRAHSSKIVTLIGPSRRVLTGDGNELRTLISTLLKSLVVDSAIPSPNAAQNILSRVFYNTAIVQ